MGAGIYVYFSGRMATLLWRIPPVHGDRRCCHVSLLVIKESPSNGPMETSSKLLVNVSEGPHSSLNGKAILSIEPSGYPKSDPAWS